MSNLIIFETAPVELTRVQPRCYVETCTGFFKATGQVLTAFPPLYVHICDTCGVEYSFNTSYPTLEYKEKPKSTSEMVTT